MKIQFNTSIGSIACAVVAFAMVSGCSRAIPVSAPPIQAQPVAKKPIALPKPPAKPAPKPIATTGNSGPLQPDGFWTSWPIAAGKWSYGNANNTTFALFGKSQRDPVIVIRCETASKQIIFARVLEFSKGQASTMRVRASDGMQSWATQIGSTGSLNGVYHGVTLLPTDPMLDFMVFSRGRFAMEVEGETSLAVPAWPEMARVIEDCR